MTHLTSRCRDDEHRTCHGITITKFVDGGMKSDRCDCVCHPWTTEFSLDCAGGLHHLCHQLRREVLVNAFCHCVCHLLFAGRSTLELRRRLG